MQTLIRGNARFGPESRLLSLLGWWEARVKLDCQLDNNIQLPVACRRWPSLTLCTSGIWGQAATDQRFLASFPYLFIRFSLICCKVVFLGFCFS
jgi:hypothetical protein